MFDYISLLQCGRNFRNFTDFFNFYIINMVTEIPRNIIVIIIFNYMVCAKLMKKCFEKNFIVIDNKFIKITNLKCMHNVLKIVSSIVHPLIL